MKLAIRYKQNKHQIDFHSDLETKFLHLSSGFGGGKSYALLMKLLKLSFLNRPYPGGLIVPDFSEFKKDLHPMLEEILELNKINYHYHKTDHTYQFPWSRGKLYVVSAEKKLRGPNWAYAGINEALLIPIERYREVVGRVRIAGAKCPQIASVGTPDGGLASPYYEILIEKPMKRSRVIYGDTRDNQENLGADYVQSMIDSFDSVMLDAYLRGLFINMNGSRFYYSFDTVKHYDRTIKENPDQNVHLSLDFNVQHMVAVAWQYDGKKLKAFDEIVIENNANTNLMCEAMIKRGYTPDRTMVYPDPAGNQRTTTGPYTNIQILKNHGFTDIKGRLKAPLMRQRQLNVNNLLDKSTIIINPDRCPYLARDLMAVEQDKATLEKIKINAKLTHASDGMDYLCDVLFPFSGKTPKHSVITIR